MSAPAKPLPQFFHLALTPEEMKFVHALVAIQNAPIVVRRNLEKGYDCEAGLRVATDLMYHGARTGLGDRGVGELFEKTQKLMEPLVFG